MATRFQNSLLDSLSTRLKGGQGSGNYGHAGRPGKVGGSAPSSGIIQGKVNPKAGKAPGWIAPDDRQVDAQLSSHLGENLPEGQTWLSCTQETRGQVKNAIVTRLSEETGVDYNTVNLMVRQWTSTSNKAVAALSLQEAACEEFGLEMSPYQKEQYEVQLTLQKRHSEQFENDVRKENPNWDYAQISQEARRRAKEYYTTPDSSGRLPQFYWDYPLADRATERKVLRAMHEITMREFKRQGIPTNGSIVVYRGLRGRPGYKAKETIPYQGNAIEAWSISPQKAFIYSPPMIAMRVPVRSVMCTARTGLGCLPEGEVIVMSGLAGASVTVLEGSWK